MENFEYLKTTLESEAITDLLLDNSMEDGRLSSAISENTVIDYLADSLSNTDIYIEKAPRPRYWYDFCIKYHGNFYPVNLKITEGRTADNISSKFGMFYALTGLQYDEIKDEGNLNHWEDFNKALKKFYCDNDKDYYFLIVFKNTNKILFTSLKRIDTLVPNGNNLPFQCNWGKNISFTTRSREEQCAYILQTFTESFKRKVSGLDILLEWEQERAYGQ